MNNCNNDEPRLDENPEPWRSQTSGGVTARWIGSVDTLSGIDHTPGVDLHFRKDAKTLSDFRVPIPDETRV